MIYFRLIPIIAMTLSTSFNLLKKVLLANSRTLILFLHLNSKLCKKEHPMTVKTRGYTCMIPILKILLYNVYKPNLFLLLYLVSSVVLSFFSCV